MNPEYEAAFRRAQRNSHALLAMRNPWTWIFLGSLLAGLGYVVYEVKR